MANQRDYSDASLPDTTSRRKARFPELFLSLILLAAVFVSFSAAISGANLNNFAFRTYHRKNLLSHVTYDEFEYVTRLRSPQVSSIVVEVSVKYESVSVLLPDWEVLVIISPETPLTSSASVEGFYCLFSKNQTSPARFSGVLPFTERTAFICVMPDGVRRQQPFWQPVLTKHPEKETPAEERELMNMKYLAYESISTDDDVVLFVKGVNSRSGANRPPQDFTCVFGDADDVETAVTTPVRSSIQEVFRCSHPDLTALPCGGADKPIKITLQITKENRTVPSVAYYTPRRTVVSPQAPKSEICACTMVYNVAKFLKEWVIFHSKIGVEKFILYDNGSDDDLQTTVNELNRDGYNVTTLLWIWTKTQEAGFSHSAIHAKDSCKWMLYVDVDEFVYSPSWDKASEPSKHMLKFLLPQQPPSLIGQVSFGCNDFGPSGQKSHPVEGVTQGYTCQRKVKERRHKSLVLLEAIDDSLYNVIHHFGLKKAFEWKQMSFDNAVVNHYKYQAWSEFKDKFRRRASSYVTDWKEKTNPNSKDRTPGLGFQAIKPKRWEQMFCDFRDDRLKLLTQRWFGEEETSNGYRMSWQR